MWDQLEYWIKDCHNYYGEFTNSLDIHNNQNQIANGGNLIQNVISSNLKIFSINIPSPLYY